MSGHEHGPLLARFQVLLDGGPFNGATVQVAGCCMPPWFFYVTRTPDRLLAWHPEEVAPAQPYAEQYVRVGVRATVAPYVAFHLPHGMQEVAKAS